MRYLPFFKAMFFVLNDKRSVGTPAQPHGPHTHRAAFFGCALSRTPPENELGHASLHSLGCATVYLSQHGGCGVAMALYT
jgi:hypothetical protein